MTKDEYLTAYRQARKTYPELTSSAMGKLRKIYIKAGAMASEAVRMAELAGSGSFTEYSRRVIEEALLNGSTLINNSVAEVIPETINSGNKIIQDIHYTYMADVFDGSGLVTKTGINNMLFAVNDRLIKSIVNRMYNDGYTLSYRIWKVGRTYQDQITRVMTAGLANGRSTVQLAKDIQVYIRDGKKALVNRYGVLERGTKAFVNRIGNTVDYRALRLVRSELYSGLQDASREFGRVNPGCRDLYDWILEAARQHWDCQCPTNQRNGPYTYEKVPAFPHANCYIDGTEVYTNKGWKHFKDLDKDEMFLSINPKTKQYEWIKAIVWQEYYLNSQVFEIKSNSFNLVVTGDHNQLIMNPQGKFYFKKIKDIYDNCSQYRIPRHTNSWIGKNIKKIKIGNHYIDSKLYCEFMGYYLSEGNVTKYTKSEFLFGKISQEKESNIKKINDCLIKMPFTKLTRTDGWWYFKENSILKDLYNYGKSYEKYVPEIIKKLTPELIKIFLDAYILGDGSTRISVSKLKNIKSKETIVTTSSKRMSEDIGELIIKAGGYPSYSYIQPKPVKHHNGIYTSKYLMYIIRWNKSLTSKFHKGENKGLTINKIPYKGMVYDVTLKEHHILWIRYKGKTCFSGNCRCFVQPVLRDRRTFVNDIKNWVNGSSIGYLDDWYRQIYKAS